MNLKYDCGRGCFVCKAEHRQSLWVVRSIVAGSSTWNDGVGETIFLNCVLILYLIMSADKWQTHHFHSIISKSVRNVSYEDEFMMFDLYNIDNGREIVNQRWIENERVLWQWNMIWKSKNVMIIYKNRLVRNLHSCILWFDHKHFKHNISTINCIRQHMIFFNLMHFHMFQAQIFISWLLHLNGALFILVYISEKFILNYSSTGMLF